MSNTNKSKHSAQISVTNVNQTYIEYLSKLFDEQGLEYRTYIKKLKGGFSGSKLSSNISSRFYTTLSDLEKEWYITREDGTHYKTIPDNLSISPNVVLQWYIGDGYLVNLRGTPVRVQFCTERYSDCQIETLKQLLSEEVGFDVQIDWNRRRLRVPKRHLSNFFDYLPECPEDIKEELGYKWI